MFNFDYVTNEGIKERNPNWPEFSTLNILRFWIQKNKCITKSNK